MPVPPKNLKKERKSITAYSIKGDLGLGVVVHTCNPSYLGGRGWEDLSSRPAWAKS
jgi:hypothetical protein